MPDQISHLLQGQKSAVVFGVQMFQTDIYDEDDLLAEVIEGDDLIKKHQIDILKAFGIDRIQMERGFCVFQIVIGEIANQTAGERRQIIEPGAAVVFDDLPDKTTGFSGIEGERTGLHMPVLTGDLQTRIVAEKSITTPFFVVRDGFQQVAMAGYVLQDPEYLDGRLDIGQDLHADRCGLVLTKAF